MLPAPEILSTDIVISVAKIINDEVITIREVKVGTKASEADINLKIGAIEVDINLIHRKGITTAEPRDLGDSNGIAAMLTLHQQMYLPSSKMLLSAARNSSQLPRMERQFQQLPNQH